MAAVAACTQGAASPVVSAEAPFRFELVMAKNLEVETLPAELRQLSLVPASQPAEGTGSVLTVPVGRHHQPELFEAWLPDMNLRSCISRKAFEVSWNQGGDNVWLLACCTNPLSVDGKIAARSTGLPLRPGSEVVFTYELKVLLRLRFLHGHASLGPMISLSASACASGVPHGKGAPTSTLAVSAAFHTTVAGSGDVMSNTLLPWTLDRAYALPGDFREDRFAGRVAQLEGIVSVTDAVEKLNSGAVPYPGGFCIVYSAAKRVYFVLYQQGMRDAAFASLGMSTDDGPSSPAPCISPGSPMVCTPLQCSDATTCELTAQVSADARSCKSKWWFTCIHAEGLSPDGLVALPTNVRDFSVPDGTTLVGRHHQPQNFEAWLPDPILRFCISRTHVQLVVSENRLTTTNMSSNLLCVDHEPLGKGETRELTHGQVMSFARHECSALVHFLILQVRSSEFVLPMPAWSTTEVGSKEGRPPSLALNASGCGSDLLTADRDAGVNVPPLTLPSPVPASAVTPVQSPSVRQSATPVSSAVGSCTSVNAGSMVLDLQDPTSLPIQCPEHLPPAPGPTMPGAGKAGTLQLPLLKPQMASDMDIGTPGSMSWQCRASGSNPPKSPEEPTPLGKSADAPEIILELCGEGVLDVPLPRRCVGPVSLGDRPLLVGRRHQPELHLCAVAEECLEFLSRDHFCVAYEGGEFWLLALTSNRIWRDRDGEEPVQLARDDLVTLLPGDRIILGTGGDASSVDAARRRLCWHFRRVDGDPPSLAAAREGCSPWWLANTGRKEHHADQRLPGSSVGCGSMRH